MCSSRQRAFQQLGFVAQDTEVRHLTAQVLEQTSQDTAVSVPYLTICQDISRLAKLVSGREQSDTQLPAHAQLFAAQGAGECDVLCAQTRTSSDCPCAETDILASGSP